MEKLPALSGFIQRKDPIMKSIVFIPVFLLLYFCTF